MLSSMKLYNEQMKIIFIKLKKKKTFNSMKFDCFSHEFQIFKSNKSRRKECLNASEKCNLIKSKYSTQDCVKAHPRDCLE